MIKLTTVLKPENSWRPIFCGAVATQDICYFVGGRGNNLIKRTKDGVKWEDVPSGGGGLRAIAVVEKRVWVSGEYALLGWSLGGGAYLNIVKFPKATACLHGLVHASDGSMWVGGDGGFLARSTDRKTFTQLKKSGSKGIIGSMADSPLGVLVPTGSGLFLIPPKAAAPKKTKLAEDVSHAIVTSKGTLIAVGAKNSVYRSTDGGKTFAKVKMPAFKAVKIAKKLEKPSWEKPAKCILCIGELADGRLVAGAEQGVIYASDDDGQRWVVVPQKVSDGQFGACAQFKGKFFLGGDHGVLFAVT